MNVFKVHQNVQAFIVSMERAIDFFLLSYCRNIWNMKIRIKSSFSMHVSMCNKYAAIKWSFFFVRLLVSFLQLANDNKETKCLSNFLVAFFCVIRSLYECDFDANFPHPFLFGLGSKFFEWRWIVLSTTLNGPTCSEYKKRGHTFFLFTNCLSHCWSQFSRGKNNCKRFLMY